MTECQDGAVDVIGEVSVALWSAFGSDSPCPTDSAPTVRFFAGDGPPLEAWNAHSSGGCDEPFLWVRVVRRYRTAGFPEPTTNVNPCGLSRVVVLEVGVARCALMDPQATWAEYADEANLSLADSRRMEIALCVAMSSLIRKDHQVGTDVILPFGPEGGVLGWTSQVYVGF